MGRNPYVKKALFLLRKNAPDPMYVLLLWGQAMIQFNCSTVLEFRQSYACHLAGTRPGIHSGIP
jgi:hypothetical protein